MALENLCTGWGFWGSIWVPQLACLLPWGPDTFLRFMETTSTKPGKPVLWRILKTESPERSMVCLSLQMPCTYQENKLCCHVATLRHSTFLNAELQLRQGPSVYWRPVQMSEGFLTTYHLQWTSLKASKVTYNQFLPSTWVSALKKELSWSGLSHLGCQSRPFSPVHVLLNLCISILRQ